MARTIDQIQQELITAIQADPTLSGLTSPSATAIWRLWTRVVAASLETEEQLQDAFKAELEQIAREAVPGTADWLQRRVLEFQYDALSPQVIQVINGKASYSTIDPALRIITRAAVKEQNNGRVTVKVAKDDGAGGLIPLDATEQLSLAGYLDDIGFVGIPIDVTSQNADRLRLENFVIYYERQQTAALVKADIITAITAYLDSISTVDFDGIVVREDIIDAIQAVDGVVTVDGYNGEVILRDSTLPAPAGTAVAVQRETVAGYVIVEDTPTYTLDDLLDLQPDNLIPNS